VQHSKSKTSCNLSGLKTFWLLFIFFLTNYLVITNSYSCTIFYAVQNGVILAGNNEDWKDPYTHMWFYPADESSHGWIKFGFGSGFPQGGMNDQGLFWDATAGPYLAMPYSEANKILIDGPVMQKVIEECANIAEALEIFNQYYCEDQYNAQYILGDSSGHSMIVEGDNVILNENNFQVLTNFIQSHPDLGGYPCWRYEKAKELLENCDSLTAWFAGTVLASTHQEGKYPTQYSNIYDLKARIIYLFYYHNYEEFLFINLQDELKKGYNTYSIPQIFSKVSLVSPYDGETISGSSVTLKWKGLPNSQYEIVLSKNPDYTDALITGIKFIETQDTQSTKAAILFPVALVISLILLIKRNKARYLFPAFVCLCLLVNCDKEDTTNEEADNTIEFSEIIEGLEPDTAYYWKIKSSTGYTDNFFTETATQSFKTLSD
jgi:hypothetical protein